jgi:hypothetical protein
MDSDPAIASHKLQTYLDTIQKWLKKWRIEANESKSVHVTFTIQRETCLPDHKNMVQLPQGNIEYLSLHRDGRLAWYKHILAKWKQLGMTVTKSKLSTAVTLSYIMQHSN